jgi:segregation and condensation protein B
VAYRQPVLKADIEAVRGVQCGEILRQLMERDLVRIGGRSDELGRPYLYTTTKRFLQQFGLRSLENLPRAEILRAPPLPPVGKRPDSGHHTSNQLESNQRVDKESDVSVTLSPAVDNEEKLAYRYGAALAAGVRLDDDEDFEDEEVDEDEDDFDDDDDEEDLDEDEEADEDEDDDLDDEEWEEVEDDEDLDEEDDEDWDDEEDEEWDDEEDEEDVDDDDEDDDWDEDEDEDEEEDEE